MGTTSTSTKTSLAGKVGNAADAGLQGAAAGGETATFIAGMTALQAQANAASLATAGLTNTKALVDAEGKVIKGSGDSVKDMAPR